MKCEHFCNYHCCTNDCPHIQCDEFEQTWDLPASEVGLERIKCKDCIYNDKHCDCNDCYFGGSKDCPKNGGKMDGGADNGNGR